MSGDGVTREALRADQQRIPGSSYDQRREASDKASAAAAAAFPSGRATAAPGPGRACPEKGLPEMGGRVAAEATRPAAGQKRPAGSPMTDASCSRNASGRFTAKVAKLREGRAGPRLAAAAAERAARGFPPQAAAAASVRARIRIREEHEPGAGSPGQTDAQHIIEDDPLEQDLLVTQAHLFEDATPPVGSLDNKVRVRSPFRRLQAAGSRGRAANTRNECKL
jgi:hypothetical protein